MGERAMHLRGPLCAVIILRSLSAVPVSAEPARARVAVVVDTSVSMRKPGMDPERTSLLVTQLLSDLVPGDLAVVRLLDLVTDGALLPNRATGRSVPCSEDRRKQCTEVEPDGDWGALARVQRLGVLERPRLGDAGFKQALDAHLEQRANNSPFELAFRAAQGVLEAPSGAERVPRVLIWLSDGQTDDPADLASAVAELEAEGVVVEAVIFGEGDLSLARSLGLEARQVSSPSRMMAAFADIFRAIAQAPFRVDHRLADTPSFEMKPNVEEAWIVVYGDESLSSAWVAGPAGEQPADAAAGSRVRAGAYRVAHVQRPAPGLWRVRAEGGGGDAAYAVIQRSDLQPALLAPERVVSGAEALIVAGVRTGLDGELIDDSDVLAAATLELAFEGEVLRLRDDGTGGDEVAADGRFSAEGRFHGVGSVPVTLRLESPVAARSITASVEVSGVFSYVGGPVVIDLGTFKAGEASCRPVVLPAKRVGEVPLELRELRALPSGLTLALRFDAGTLELGGSALPSRADEVPELCLRADRRAGSSSATGEPWLELALAGSDEAGHAVQMALRWQVQGLGFWELWGRLILALASALLLAFLAGGYLWPQRFQRALALAMAPDLGDLGEQSPQPVAQWQGVGIGFYRHAQAFLHPDFRLSGKARGSLASLEAAKRATWVRAGTGRPLFRETLDGTWEAVDPRGRRTHAGDVYRIGEHGPYFRIAVQGGRR